MSYDLHLFRPRPEEDADTTARRESDLPTTPADPENEALKRKVADALIALNPQLKVFQFGYDAIAKSQNISVEEARVRFRHLELNGPEDSNGIQITLFDDEASVTVPYWHQGPEAIEVFREIWSYLESIHDEAGYLVFDPQLERILDLSNDFDAVVACYVGVVAMTKPMVTTTGAQKKKPWWRFW